MALSIVGVDRVDSGYYAGKRVQEQLVLSGPVPASVLRATQFHEFAGQILALTRGPVAPVPVMHILPDLARRLLRARGQRRFVLPLRGPVAASRAVAGGALLPTGSGPRGTQTFDEWLATRGARRTRGRGLGPPVSGGRSPRPSTAMTSPGQE